MSRKSAGTPSAAAGCARWWRRPSAGWPCRLRSCRCRSSPGSRAPDPVPGELDGQAPDERQDAVFGRGVAPCGAPRGWPTPRTRPPGSRPRPSTRWRAAAQGQEGAVEVDRHHPAPLVQRHVDERDHAARPARWRTASRPCRGRPGSPWPPPPGPRRSRRSRRPGQPPTRPGRRGDRTSALRAVSRAHGHHRSRRHQALGQPEPDTAGCRR